MFEDIEVRAARAAEARARARAEELAARIAGLVPRGVSVTVAGDGVLISGRGLKRRLVRDASLRWTVAGLVR